MNVEVKSKALRRIKDARSTLIMEHPFFGCLLMYMKLIEVPYFPGIFDTMAVDGKHLFWCKEFVESISDDELTGVLVHEGYHIAFKHHVRMAGRNPELWNEACDYVINLEVIRGNFTLPKHALLDNKYIGWTVEEVYNDLLANRKKKPKPKKGEGKGGGKGDEQGKGEGPSCPDTGRCGGVILPSDDAGKAALDAESNKWDAIVRTAVSIAKRQNAGNIPGFLERIVDDLLKPKIDWETKLRKYIDQSIVKEMTWLNPNKRFVHRGLYLPGPISNSINKIVSVMDTSGSVTDQLVAKYASEKRAILDEGYTDSLVVMYADSKVYADAVQEFQRGDLVRLRPVGGGGTNFRPAFEYIREHQRDASLILFFTDLYAIDFGDDPDIPVLWIMYGTKAQYEERKEVVPFGEVIYAGIE